MWQAVETFFQKVVVQISQSSGFSTMAIVGGALAVLGFVVMLWMLIGCFPAGVPIGRVSRLFVHPVKGCRGMDVSEWAVGPTGLLWDRCWMLVREDTGEFLTQRHASVLAGISAEPTWVGPDSGDRKPWDANALKLSAAGRPLLVVPLVREEGVVASSAAKPRGAGEKRDVTVFGKTLRGIDQGDEASKWFTETLKALGGDLVPEGCSAKPNDLTGVSVRLLHCPSTAGAESAEGGPMRSIKTTVRQPGFMSGLSFVDGEWYGAASVFMR
jgi:hypothetical protein